MISRVQYRAPILWDTGRSQLYHFSFLSNAICLFLTLSTFPLPSNASSEGQYPAEAYPLIAALIPGVVLDSALTPVVELSLEACGPVAVLRHPEVVRVLNDDTLAAELLLGMDNNFAKQ